jgi:DNA repair exonuclease SbcCD ATPase subunit
MPESETASPAPGQVADAPQSTPSSLEFGADQSATAPEAASGQTNGQEDQKPQSHQQKRESRYERTKRQRAALQEREAALKAREERIAQTERAKQAPQKPDYSLADLKEYRKAWAEEAQWDPAKADLVVQADKEIKRLEGLEKSEQSQEAFTKEWQTAEAELAQSDQEFMRSGTRLDSKLREIMAGPDGNVYRGHPRGIVAAYHRARMEILESDHQGALGKIHELETELKRLTGLTSLGGGAPGRMGNGNVDFSRLSSADMRKRLLSQAKSNAGDVPWL